MCGFFLSSSNQFPDSLDTTECPTIQISDTNYKELAQVS